ncbi:MAG: hypothetical protein IT562_19245 [Alphaproteobacteria bacterium]|nr:hypothetical protein [Alphaproteobacteria bacterium]
MSMLRTLFAAAALLVLPFAAMAHCSPQHTVSITPAPATADAPQTPVPTPPTVGG